MKAAQITDYGDATKIAIVDTLKPTIAEGQVLVKVAAAGLNPFDTTVREGRVSTTMPLNLPATLGGDLAGIIVDAAPDVTHIHVGDQVYGSANVFSGGSGAFAEYATTPARLIAKAPTNISPQEAAGLPLVASSALQALTTHINLQPGQKLFINGAGGIGMVAIQLAKHIGAHVAITATGDDIETAKAMGADEVIDYQTQDFTSVISDYDAAYDTVGGDLFAKVIRVLKVGGLAVTMVGPVNENQAKEHGITAIAQFTRITTSGLDSIRELVEQGILNPHIGKVFPFDEIQAAFQARETRAVSGKIVLSMS